MTGAPPYDRHGPAEPASPVVLSVPHAGRDYPLALRAALRVAPATLIALEDRHADTLALAARGAETLFVATRPRAWIDLNRAETERDPRVDEGADPIPDGAMSLKLRSGLGLIPRRVGGADLWRRRFSDEEVRARIGKDHRPYHAALADALAAARARFGVAVLIDVHSMPPLARGGARLVIGDRFGRAAATRFVSRIEASAHSAGVRTALNTPYAGGYVLARHADPGTNIHAIQLEFDRSLYLDRRQREPGAGFDATVALLRRVVDAVADETLPLADAAE
ncbi:N-formylglutamate amidohydrolase [Sphingomonas sp.]|uniref:N-formylglutamate amidohydrolase n=1 Tax=Sphingomonas sp. TaxID=28214 RepID=UPI001EC3C222|nr:N-formylglutamate amidohydrolase [Sphingomonas sp.]MBX3594596.1 N-formylglutamate amidohydrolase [Sphingomonas sp.]